jgi:hypothetical protein
MLWKRAGEAYSRYQFSKCLEEMWATASEPAEVRTEYHLNTRLERYR